MEACTPATVAAGEPQSTFLKVFFFIGMQLTRDQEYALMSSSCSLRASSGGVLEMEQGAAPAHRFRTPGPGRPSGLHLGANLRAPRQELADVQVANGLDEKRGPRTEIAAVERREARRSAWTGNLRRTGDRPDREAGHEVRRIPHQRRLGAPPPSPLEGEVPQTSG